MPYDSTLILEKGVSVRWLSPTQVLLSQQRLGKTKYKNVGNAEVKDVIRNTEQKSQSYWWLWL